MKTKSRKTAWEDAAPATEDVSVLDGEDQDAGPVEEIWFDSEEPVPAGLRDYAATQIFGRKLRLGEAAFSETWPAIPAAPADPSGFGA